jgi:hypothetical protein
MSLAPEIRGSISIRSAPWDFLQSFQQRVARGLLSGQPHPRSNYIVTRADPQRLHLQAADWRTAVNVGLNEVDLELPQPGTVGYRVYYWRWASYVIGLGAVLGAIGLLLLVTFDVRSYISQSQSRMIPGLSVDENVVVLWAMVLFWGFVWPWLLIQLHKGPLRRMLTRLIAEVDEQALTADRA